MYKNVFVILSTLLLLMNGVSAKELQVKITPKTKISTANILLKEGDNVNFVVSEDVFDGQNLYLKKGEPVLGVITSLKDNDFYCEEAYLYADQFKTKDFQGKKIKLSGSVYKKGRTHELLTQFIGAWFIRGGEAQIIPNKDIFTLLVEVSK